MEFSWCPQLSVFVSVREFNLRVGLLLVLFQYVLLPTTGWRKDRHCLLTVRPNKPPLIKPHSPVRHSFCPWSSSHDGLGGAEVKHSSVFFFGGDTQNFLKFVK